MKAERYIFLVLLIVIASCTVPSPEPNSHSVMDQGVASDTDLELVDVTTLDPEFVLDVRYATENNFTGKAVYTPDEARCLLRRPVAEALVAAHADLKGMGYRLKIFDCFRPIAVQQRLFEVFPDPDYVAQPEYDVDGVPVRGSKHNRGAAVDLTLIHKDGSYVDMPTDYDDFSERAHPDDPMMSDAHRANVQLLAQAMTRHGFTPIRTEWWHFDGPNWERYPLQ